MLHTVPLLLMLNNYCEGVGVPSINSDDTSVLTTPTIGTAQCAPDIMDFLGVFCAFSAH